jgi:hypothetical protein
MTSMLDTFVTSETSATIATATNSGSISVTTGHVRRVV